MSDPQAVTMMSALAILSTVNELILPAVEADGTRVKMIWDPTVALMQRIAEGETADGIFAIDWALDELAAKGMIDVASRRPVARAVVGLAVRPGAPRPDISSAEALRATLLATPSLVFSKAGASGIFFERMIDRMGIADEIRAKALIIPRGLTGERLAAGDVEIAIQQLSELMAVPGIDVVGAFPDDVHSTTDFGAALFTGAKNPAGAMRFIDELLSEPTRAHLLSTGMFPRI